MFLNLKVLGTLGIGGFREGFLGCSHAFEEAGFSDEGLGLRGSMPGGILNPNPRPKGLNWSKGRRGA